MRRSPHPILRMGSGLAPVVAVMALLVNIGGPAHAAVPPPWTTTTTAPTTATTTTSRPTTTTRPPTTIADCFPGCTVVRQTFEDGTVQGWAGGGGVVVENSTDMAYAGARSLKVSNLTTTTSAGVTISGAGLDSPIGYEYTATARARLAPGQPPTYLRLSVSGARSGSNVRNVPTLVRSDAWYTLTTYFYPAGGAVRLGLVAGTGCTGDLMTVGSPLYLDDVAVGIPPVGQTTTVPELVIDCPPPSTTTTTRPTTTTTTLSSPTCSASYLVTQQWSNGFLATLRIKNLTTSPMLDWQVRWAFTNGEKILSLWPGTWSQSGAVVTVRAPLYQPSILANGTIEISMVASAPASGPRQPVGIMLNGRPCGNWLGAL